jgi:hypothetical protein
MTLTFRSTAPETRVVIEREPDGRQRVARATRNPAATRHWDLRVEHPSGENWSGTFIGDTADVTLALAEMLRRSENEWKSDKSRGDRPRTEPYDHNRRVVDGVAPVQPIPKRG